MLSFVFIALSFVVTVVVSVEDNSTASCTKYDCNQNGLCVGTKQQFSCLCDFGFSGVYCQYCKRDSLIIVTMPYRSSV